MLRQRRAIQFGLLIVSLFCFAWAYYLRVHAPIRVMGGSVVLGPPGAKAKAWPAASFQFSVKPSDIRVSQMAEAVLTVTVTAMHGASFVGEPTVQLQAPGFVTDNPPSVSLRQDVPAEWKWQLQPSASGDKLIAANIRQTVVSKNGKRWKCDLRVYPPTIPVSVQELSALTLQNISISVGILAALGGFAGPLVHGLTRRRAGNQQRRPVGSRKLQS